MIAVSSVQYASGFRVDLAGLGQLCRDRGWALCVDGIQSLGAIPIDVKSLGVHFLAADSHKWLLGPPGVGVLFVDRGVDLDPALVGWRSTTGAFDFDRARLELRPDAARFEEGSLQYALIEAMGASMELLLDVGMERVWERIRTLGDHLVDRLLAAGHSVGSAGGEARSGSVLFRTAEDPVALVERLSRAGFALSARRGQVRASPHFYNTAAELDRLVAAL
jgi:selenocysteine lyase/cysteine desulfurase